MRVAAPAKLNLGLRIVGRRPDGYHELASAFVPIDLADALELQIAPAVHREVTLRVTGEAADVPPGRENLAVRAAEGFLEAAGRGARVEIRLDKRIPAGAGLGGGSSDAGAVLRGLAAHFPGALSAEALARLALRLGADVPFFLAPAPSLVTGIGERIAALPGRLPRLWLLLVKPAASLATGRVFAAWDAAARSGARPFDPAPAWRAALARPPAEFPAALAGLLHNDLAAAAEALCPQLAELREALGKCGARAVGLSGSGPTLYGVFAGREAAEAARGRPAFQPPVWCRLARTLQAG